MKKFLAAALTVSAMVLPLQGFAQTIDHESGAMSREEASQLGPQMNFYGNDGAAVVGGIIGGIIGAIAADAWDKQHPGHGGGWGPGHGPGDGFITCYAQNRRGEMFRASSRFARVAQDRALEKCYDVSRACRPMGCR